VAILLADFFNLPVAVLHADYHPIEQIGDIPAEPMAEDGLRPAIAEIVAKLPPNAHQALKLRFADGLSNQEAAKQSECLIDTFRKRVHYALEKIRLHLQDRSES